MITCSILEVHYKLKERHAKLSNKMQINETNKLAIAIQVFTLSSIARLKYNIAVSNL